MKTSIRKRGRKRSVASGFPLRRLLSDLQWCAQEGSEYLLSVRDCKALVAVLCGKAKK